MNYDGQLTVRAVHSGGDTAVADIVRLVESAQVRSLPWVDTAPKTLTLAPPLPQLLLAPLCKLPCCANAVQEALACSATGPGLPDG